MSLLNTINPNSLNATGRLAFDLAKFNRRFVRLQPQAEIVLAPWAMHSYICDLFEFTPYLNIVSPEPGCGKTTTGDVLASLCHRATSPMGGSAAVLRRRVASERPCLILDEWDSLPPETRKACTNFLNTGFRRDGKHSLMVGKEVVDFSTFCPKAILGRSIVALDEATLSRCIPLTMQKALPDENLEKFREPHRQEAAALRERCERWAEKFRKRTRQIPAAMPESFSARQRDISEPLLAIADACAGPWPSLLRNALGELFVSRIMPTPENELLRAVQQFAKEQQKRDFLLSQEFCIWANAQEERPWSAERDLTPAKMADMLRHYGIFPRQINRIVDGKQKNVRGYLLTDFEDAIVRYVASAPTFAEAKSRYVRVAA